MAIKGLIIFSDNTFLPLEPVREKSTICVTPGYKQTGMYSHRRWSEAGIFRFRKMRNCTIRVAKTKVQISFAASAKCLISDRYKIQFSHDAAELKLRLLHVC